MSQDNGNKKTITSIELSNEEKLSFENLNLKRQLLNIQLSNINEEETNLINKISQRIGANVQGWHLNIQKGILTQPPTETPEVPATNPLN